MGKTSTTPLTRLYEALANNLEEITGRKPEAHFVSFEVYSRLWVELYRAEEKLMSPEAAKARRLMDMHHRAVLAINGIPIRAIL